MIEHATLRWRFYSSYARKACSKGRETVTDTRETLSSLSTHVFFSSVRLGMIGKKKKKKT